MQAGNECREMIKVVIDTNVIISAALTPNGIPAGIIEHVTKSDEIELFYSIRILDEYEKVLSYEKLHIDVEK